MSQKTVSALISHSWKDKLFAEKISEHLTEFCDVWMDYRQLNPGDDIQAVIDKSLANVDIMLLLWSSSSAQSDNVSKEIQTALRLKTRIIPCFIEYDNQSVAQPALPSELQKFLGIDFHHFNTGLVRLISYILQRNWQHDDNFCNDPRTKLILELDGMMDYLSNYRNTKDTGASRSEWIKQIIKLFDDYIAGGGDAKTLEPLLQAACQNQHNDPEGIDPLINKLELLLGKKSCQTTEKKKKRKKNKSKKSKKQKDDVLNQMIKAIAPKAQRKHWSLVLDDYINAAPNVLNAMQIYCVGVNSPAGCEVVNFLKTYLDNKDDLISDDQGRYGYLDDAWLIHNTAYRLIEAKILPGDLILLDWQAIIVADQIALNLIPNEIIRILDQYVTQMFALIVAEVQTYQPVFGQTVMSGGQAYADQWYDVGVEAIQNM